MPITYKLLGKVIAECYFSKPQVEEDFVSFGVDVDDFAIEVTISLFDEPSNTNTERQAIQIWMWFCHLNKQRFNVAQMAFPELLAMCYTLQEELNWCTIAPHRIDEDLVHIGCYLSIDITEEDLMAACNKNGTSHFLRTLERMSFEGIDLFEPFAAISEGQVYTLSQLDLLLGEPEGYA